MLWSDESDKCTGVGRIRSDTLVDMGEEADLSQYVKIIEAHKRVVYIISA